MKQREKFSTRIGFILISAGCAIGLGNIWRFPYIVGAYGGGAFVLIYLVFLILLAAPIMAMEFSVGRASQKSVALSFNVLEPKGSKWHWFRYPAMAGNYLLMMFYTTITGWMLAYLLYMIRGDFSQLSSSEVASVFDGLIGSAGSSIFWMVIACIIGFSVCALGLQSGVERITKVMMGALLLIMFVLVIRSVTLKNASEGLRFYLVPNWDHVVENGLGNTVYAALGQAFFTLSIGMGSMAIFGSYLPKTRRLAGETLSVTLLDIFVALMAGLIIFPACFAYGVNPDSGTGLIFITLPNIFSAMAGGRLWGSLFFVFMSFASLSTVIAVFENIVSFATDLTGCSRQKASIVNAFAVIVLSLPCALGFNKLSHIAPLGEGTVILDFEDFLVSNNILPLGALVYLFFCTTRFGWGWDNFIKEADAGKGIKFPIILKYYLKYIVPIIILIIFILGYKDLFF